MLPIRLYPPHEEGPVHVARLAIELAGSADLGSMLVVVPVPGVAPAIRAALAAEGALRGLGTLAAPRIATLELLIGEVELAQPVMPGARRLADLHRLLAGRGWFGGAPGWDTCRAVLALADELSAALPEPPGESEFLRLIEAHYRGRAARVATPEARLVYEVWRAYARPARGAALDPGIARRMRLAAAAGRTGGALIWLCARPHAQLGVAESTFVQACATHAQVTLVAPDGLLPVLEAAWPNPAIQPIALRAGRLAHGDMDWFSRIEVIAAPSLEAEADAAARTVRVWLAQGKRSIALIAQDRVVARRVRALLERADVLVADEAGWKLSTTSAATCAMRWIDVVSGGFHQRDLTDWLRSPFVFAELGRVVRRRALAAIDRAVREHNLLAGLPALRHALVRQGAAGVEAISLLERVEAAARPWGRRSAPLDEWFALLLDSLAQLGAIDALSADAAGELVLGLADDLRGQLTGSATQTLATWREFFAAELEGATFRDSAIDSPVLMTSLMRAQSRRFDAVLLLGAGAAHLEEAGEPVRLMAARLRPQLQLTTPEEQVSEMRDRLGMLIAHSGALAVTWRAGGVEESQPLSHFFVRLDALARAAGRPGLIRPAHGDAAATAAAAGAAAVSTTSRRPAPGAAVLRPEIVSVSAYASLIACPYQFFARHMLGLNQTDEVREEFEKSDYGQWVHAMLNRLHVRFPRFTGLSRDLLLTEFHRLADEVFAAAIEFNFLSTGWKARWAALADSYVDWQIEREAAGWHWQTGELPADVAFALGAETEIRLRGRLDRIDTREASHEVEILDYKTQDIGALRRKVAEPGEDVQLAAYRLLHPVGAAARAAFVAVDGGRIACVAANPAHGPVAERGRLTALFQAIDAGAPLPANAIEGVCAWCEMRGLCRRDHWDLAEPARG